jgi:YHS domain-containing protein
LAIDPVCKMNIDETKTELKSEHEGKMYYFCNSGCKETFEKDPEQYVA